jgi:hypothetical protein
MAIYLSNINEAYGPLLASHWEKGEIPQHYDQLPSQLVHPTPHRHVLGLVGGNEVSLIKGNMVDMESDLRGITIPNTFCPSRMYHPLAKGQTEVVRENSKSSLKINIQPAHLPVYQMIAYPSVMAPTPMKNEVCMKPEKY